MKKGMLYVHGKGGNYLEAEQYKQNCTGFDIIGAEYNGDKPWVAKDQILYEYDKLSNNYENIYILANSIGAYFAMLALQNSKSEKALFISPIVDMEQLILDMMQWANVTEEKLFLEKEIQTNFGETLSWEYLQYIRNNPVEWNTPTEVLYAEKDNLTSQETIDFFVQKNKAHLTVMQNGEHWFHTEEQVAFLNEWMRRNVVI